jgi:AT hook motif
MEITHKITRGTGEKSKKLLILTRGGSEFNTDFIEHLNGTFRECLTSLTHKCRHTAARLETLDAGMYLIGCTYNLCFPHQELSKKSHFGRLMTPAMAAALTDHIWSMQELLWHKVAPAPWRQTTSAQPKRPRGRPPKYVLAQVIASTRERGTFTT